MITYSSPCRIDYTGGTLDIYPLSKIFSPFYTINQAISICTYATLISFDDFTEKTGLELGDSSSIIVSADLKEVRRVDEESNTLEVFVQIMDEFELNEGYLLLLESEAPLGSGLAASSSLIVSTLSVCAAVSGLKLEKNKILYMAHTFETKLLGTLTGIQDYFPAIYGGVNMLYFGREKFSHDHFSSDGRIDHSRNIHLVHTSKAHMSGNENWNMVKQVIEASGDPHINQVFRDLAALSSNFYEFLTSEMRGNFSRLLREEGELRAKLIPTYYSDEMYDIISLVAHLAVSHKPMGAGNGGVLAIFSSSKNYDLVKQILGESNYEVLDFTSDNMGTRSIEGYNIDKFSKMLANYLLN